MKTQVVPYQIGNQSFEGVVYYEEKNLNRKKPAVLVAHAWKGQDDFARGKAEELAKLGYIGFAADLFGKGIHAENNEQAFALISPLFVNRQELRDRISGSLKAMQSLPQVDASKMGAIGFCFGGLSVTELLRSGAPVRGVVSFHGIMGDSFGELRAKRVSNAPHISGSILFLHGHDDPLVSSQDILSVQKEFTDAKIDWQMNIYGHTSHAFMVPTENNPKAGLVYQSTTARRAWLAMQNFFDETLR